METEEERLLLMFSSFCFVCVVEACALKFSLNVLRQTKTLCCQKIHSTLLDRICLLQAKPLVSELEEAAWKTEYRGSLLQGH